MDESSSPNPNEPESTRDDCNQAQAIRATSNGAAMIELNRFDDRPSLTESTFRPLCLSVAAIHSIEPFVSTHYPGVKARLYLRKNGSGGYDRLELSEDYP